MSSHLKSLGKTSAIALSAMLIAGSAVATEAPTPPQPKQTWKEWIMGKPAKAETPFTADQAKKIATDAGYQLSGEPIAEKKHFQVTATKNGQSYDLDIHRDGNIKADTAFSAEQAKKLATDAGYQVSGEPVPEKKHYQLTASKDGKSYELDVHRDGNIKADAAFSADDAKALATGKGYQLSGEPTREKKHYVATATKDGKMLELEIHRDGNIEAVTPFGVAEAKKEATDGGYEVVGAPRAEKKHFEMLAKKDGKYFEVHAHRDGQLKGIREVDKSDPKWGTAVQ